MANKNKRHDMSTFGGRLAFYREKAGLTQQGLAEEIFSTRQLVNAWEKNKRFSYTEYLDKICTALNVDESLLLNGVSKENQIAASELGLSEASIEFLKSLKGDYYVPFVDTDSDEVDATGIDGSYLRDWNNRDERLHILVEGGYPDELLRVINLLLASTDGKMILAMIAKFISINFNDAYVNGERCIEIEYNVNSEGRKKTTVDTSIMKYAILQAISSKLEDLRVEAEEGRK